jgi:hypothetical protein
LIRNGCATATPWSSSASGSALNNPGFNPVEFDGIKNADGAEQLRPQPKQWIAKTGALGLRRSAGRYGGTYAHQDIAFEFGSWVSALNSSSTSSRNSSASKKTKKRPPVKLGWNLQRTLSKINYRIHTDAIRETLIPPAITKSSRHRWSMPTKRTCSMSPCLA